MDVVSKGVDSAPLRKREWRITLGPPGGIAVSSASWKPALEADWQGYDATARETEGCRISCDIRCLKCNWHLPHREGTEEFEERSEESTR